MHVIVSWQVNAKYSCFLVQSVLRVLPCETYAFNPKDECLVRMFNLPMTFYQEQMELEATRLADSLHNMTTLRDRAVQQGEEQGTSVDYLNKQVNDYKTKLAECETKNSHLNHQVRVGDCSTQPLVRAVMFKERQLKS